MFNRNIFVVVMVAMFGFVFIAPTFAEAASCTCNVSNQTVRCPVHRCYGGTCRHNRVEQSINPRVSRNGNQYTGQVRSPEQNLRLLQNAQRIVQSNEQHAQRLQEQRENQFWRNVNRNDSHNERVYRQEQQRVRDSIRNGRDMLNLMRDWRNFRNHR